MSHPGQRVLLVCYDIADDRRRTKVYQAMCGAGERLQYSVFRCVMSDLQLAVLKETLTNVIDGLADQILFVPLGRADAPASWSMSTLGRPLLEPARSVRVV